MAVTENVFLPIGDPGGPSSGQTQFSFNFPYLEDTDVKVSLDGVDTTAYTFANATTIQFNTAPSDGVVVRIYRDTNNDNPRAVFYPGSVIRAQDLNNNFDQILYVTQEVDNNAWDNETDTVKSTNTWVSSDDKVATTAAIDARFQDELNDTLDSNEAWVSSDDYIATTASIDQRIDTAITNDIAGSDGISITDDGDGTITVGISANSVDLDRIKDEDIITYAEQEAGNSWLSDTRIPTTFAAARRFDTLVQPTTPTGSTWAVGKTWLQNDQDLTVSVWNGTNWLAVASGGAFTNQPKVVYVDATAGDDNNDGHRISRPKATIKAAIAQINADATYGDGSVVVVAPGVYQEVAPIDITKKDVSIIGTALRSCIVHPTPATETNSLFRVNSGTFLQNLTFTGVKASGVRGGAGSVDPDATYGLPVTQGWNVSFYPGAMIYKSPYIQNCTNFSDSEINNANLNAHTPAGGSAGDTDSAVTGGGLLVDGSVVDSSSPLRSMVCDSYTHVGLDGPGILVTNNGYAQCTSSYAFFNHYHIKCLNGGQANLAASTTDFGRYGLIADGRSTSAIFTATTTVDAADQDITFTIDAPVAGANWHGSATRPQSNMLVDIGGNTYPVLSAIANGTGWDVTISRPDPTNTADNLGLNGAVLTGAAVSFYLRSMVASSGHTMEYAGSGTNYSALPENGGVPVEANQVLELNDGKVWTAITDHNGKFKLGNFFTVDQQTSTVSVQTGSFAVSLENLQVNPGGNAVIGANLDLNGSSILDSTGNVTIADVLSMSNNKIINVGGPTDSTDAANKGYVDGYAVAKAGDTMTGALTLAADPTSNLEAATKQYVDNNLPPGTTVSATAPSSPGVGDLWYDSVGGRLYVWYDDGTSSQWVDVAPQGNRISEFEQGTAAAPGLYVVGDTNTGIYSPGADQLAISTNGTGRLFVDSSGRVSLVAASTTHDFDVLKTFSGATTSARIGSTAASGVNNATLILNSGGTGNSTLRFDYESATNYASISSTSSSQNLIFGTGGSERMTLDSSGRLGLGTSTPRSLLSLGAAAATSTATPDTIDLGGTYSNTAGANLKLRIFFDGISSSGFGASAGQLDYRSITGDSHAFYVGNSQVMKIDGSGRVGVGTASPEELMHLNASSSGSLVDLLKIDNGGGATGTEAGIVFECGTDRTARISSANTGSDLGALKFWTAGSVDTLTERARIDSSGRLLVGTASGSGEPIAAFQGRSNDANDSGMVALTRAGTNPSGSIGELRFATGSDFNKYYGMILCQSDGTTSSTSLPGRLVFSTTADGASSPTQSMIIYNDGEVQIARTTAGIWVGTTVDGAYRIGRSSYAVSSGTLYIGNAAIQVSSDARLKENIEDTQLDALAAINRIKVKDFTWNDPTDTSANNRNARGKWTGLIAQELIEVLPFVVNAPRKEEDGSIDYESESIWTLDQSQLCPVLIKAVQQQQEIIAMLEARVAALETP